MRTSELTGAALDWAVAKCEGVMRPYIHAGFCKYGVDFCGNEEFLMYSTDWLQGGPIIEREGIPIRKHSSGTWYAHMNLGDGERAQWHKHEWVTSKVQKQVRFDGPTPLVAAMRCYVASKLGDEVDVPEEL